MAKKDDPKVAGVGGVARGIGKWAAGGLAWEGAKVTGKKASDAAKKGAAKSKASKPPSHGGSRKKAAARRRSKP